MCDGGGLVMCRSGMVLPVNGWRVVNRFDPLAVRADWEAALVSRHRLPAASYATAKDLDVECGGIK